MKEIFSTEFEKALLPEEWIEEEHNYSFENNALRSGRYTKLLFSLPGKGWNKLRVEMEVEIIDGAALTFGDETINLIVDLKRGTSTITYFGTREIATAKLTPRMSGTCLVAFEFDHGKMQISVEGNSILSAINPRSFPLFGLMNIGLWDDCRVHRIRVFGDEEAASPVFSHPKKEDKNFELEVNVDFFDDLLYAPWTKEMFDQLFAEFKSWGVKRCHWIYYGDSKNDGLMENVNSPVCEHYRKTIENVGEIFPTAVKAAHAHGIEIYGMVKPFDMGFNYSYGESSDEGKAKGRLQRIGGPIGWIANFPARNRQYIMSRKPGCWGEAKSGDFTRIDLVKENSEAATFTVNDIRIYVSNDNTSYVPYNGPMEREEVVEDYPVWEHTASGGRVTGAKASSRVMRLKNLKIPEKYVALSVDCRDASFKNNLVNILHVFGENGEERLLTYGVTERSVKFIPTTNAFWIGTKDFQNAGIEFDMQPGTPTMLFPGYNPMEAKRAFDAGDGIIAFARGKEQGLIAALSPSFPEARQWWLSWLKACLDAGADGIELRERNHHSPFAWLEYGFEKPIRDEFLKRHGVDIWESDDFDKAAWRRLRGEAYTQFYREARALANSYGKPMGVHIGGMNMMEVEQGAAMELHWDWKAWLEEGLADSVTMKDLWPGSAQAEEVLAYTRPRKIKTIFCPYANNIWMRPKGEDVCANWIHLAQKHDYDGFQYYECAAVIKGKADGTLTMEQPGLRRLFQTLS